MPNNKIQIKRTSVSGKTPNTTNIDVGELALNVSDGIMYSTNGSVVFEIGANNVNARVTGTLTVNAVSANGSLGSAGQVLHSNGSTVYWDADDGGGGGGNYTASNTAPGSPSAGDEWFETDTGVLYTYVTDGDGSQWVELGPYNSLAPVLQGNLDGGAPDSVYGGITALDAGGVS
jgi:hypothetical protein